MQRAVVLFVGFATLAYASGVAFSAPAVNPTARCKDGSPSYAVHHSGACSHHGGVAVWLDGSSSRSTATVALGVTVKLRARTETSHCKLGPDPDAACSPGAYYSRLTTAVICSSSFHTSAIRNVSESEKHAVEQEYGLAPASYGRTLEIDHIVSLELGGSNDIANLFPEKADANPGYHVKDRLENRLHSLVCSGSMTLRSAQDGIARNWQALYTRVFDAAPS